MTPKNFSRILPKIWCAETAATPEIWMPDNPALEQCAVTAALADEVMGVPARGDTILNCEAKLPDGSTRSHYLNLINAGLQDYTAQQFPLRTLLTEPQTKDRGLGSTRNYVLSFPNTLRKYALLRSRAAMHMTLPRAKPWLLLDMDDTLIYTQPIYHAAYDKMAQHIAGTDRAKRKEVIAFAEAIGAELIEPLAPDSPRRGFGRRSNRIITAFTTTLDFFCPKAVDEDVLKVRGIAREIFNTQAELQPGAAALVQRAKDKGYKVGIITQGEEEVQRRRLAQLPFMHQIDGVLVIPSKTAETFNLFCQAHAVDIKRSWMLGDSLKSDIHPAHEAGLRTIWYSHTQGWKHESHGHQPPDVTCVVRHLDLALVS